MIDRLTIIKKSTDKKVTNIILILVVVITSFLMKAAPTYVQVITMIFVSSFCIITFVIYIAKGKVKESILMVIGSLFGIFVILIKYLEFKKLSVDYLMLVLPILLITYYITMGVIVYKSGNLERINKAKKILSIGIVSSICILVLFIYLISI
jgi:hypothetical protein